MRRSALFIVVVTSFTAACSRPTAQPARAGGVAGPVGFHEPACAPTGGGPYWLLEGETVEFRPSCTSGIALAPSDFTVSPIPSGAHWDAKQGLFSWTPALDQAAVYHLTLSVPASGEAVDVKIGVADDFQDPSNVPPHDPTTYTEEYGLPVVWLSSLPSSATYADVSLTYAGHVYHAQAKIRGVTSSAYPKQSYSVKFDKSDEFEDPSRDFIGKKGIALRAAFDDNSYLRDRLAFDLWNRMDPAHVQIGAYNVAVYGPKGFAGIYTLTDKIDDHLMKANGLDGAGNLYSAKTHDCNFRLVVDGTSGTLKATPHQGYLKTDGLPADGQPGAYDDLDSLVTFVATAGASTFHDQIATRIDVSEYEDWWVFVTFMVAADNAGKNSFHFHSPYSSGGVFRYVPWDFNATFGQDWQTIRTSAQDGDTFTTQNNLFARLLADATFHSDIKKRYAAILRGPWNEDDLLALVDARVAEIEPVARRDEAIWGATYRAYPGFAPRTDFNSHDQEVAYLRAWIQQRWKWQAARFPSP